jgi:hypothetical protein
MRVQSQISDYCCTDHWAKAIFFSEWKSAFMGVFTAYFDASGSPDDPHVHYLTVAGFIATADQWSLFDRRWKKILKKYGVTKLHMKEFSHSQGEFVGWDVDPKKSQRPLLISSLVTLLQRMMRHSFATTISLDDYRENEKTYHIRKVASPLAIAGMMVMDNLKEVAISLPIKQLLVLFEDGDADRKNLKEWVSGFGFKPHFIPKDDIKAFEACDLLAYEHLQASKKVMPQPGIYALEDLRKSFQRLHEIPHQLNGSDHWGVITNPELEECTKEMLASDRRPGLDRYPVTKL